MWVGGAHRVSGFAAPQYYKHLVGKEGGERRECLNDKQCRELVDETLVKHNPVVFEIWA